MTILISTGIERHYTAGNETIAYNQDRRKLSLKVTTFTILSGYLTLISLTYPNGKNYPIHPHMQN